MVTRRKNIYNNSYENGNYDKAKRWLESDQVSDEELKILNLWEQSLFAQGCSKKRVGNLLTQFRMLKTYFNFKLIVRSKQELSLDEMCERWTDSHAKALELHARNPEKLLIVNYDEQVENPAQTYERIATFVGVSNMFDISGIKPTNAKNFLSQSEVEYIKAKTSDMAREFKYSL